MRAVHEPALVVEDAQLERLGGQAGGGLGGVGVGHADQRDESRAPTAATSRPSTVTAARSTRCSSTRMARDCTAGRTRRRRASRAAAPALAGARLLTGRAIALALVPARDEKLLRSGNLTAVGAAPAPWPMAIV